MVAYANVGVLDPYHSKKDSNFLNKLECNYKKIAPVFNLTLLSVYYQIKAIIQSRFTLKTAEYS